MAFVSVTWTDLVNCVALPGPNDLTKTGGVDGQWDAGAKSVQQIESAVEGCGIRFGLKAGGANGLSHDNPGQHYDQINFCIMSGWGDIYTCDVYENGVWIMEVWGYNPYKIIINAIGKIEYWGYKEAFDEWELFYTSTNAPVYPLFFDTSIAPFVDPPQISQAMVDAGVVIRVDHLMVMGVH